MNTRLGGFVSCGVFLAGLLSTGCHTPPKASAAGVSAVASVPAVAATPKKPTLNFGNPNYRHSFAAMEEAREGENLTEQQVKALEEKLKNEPEDLSARTQLLGYYSERYYDSRPAKEARQRHILWLIENHPDAAILRDGMFARLDSHMDGAAFEKGLAIWLKHVENYPSNATVHGMAARFCLLEDSETAERLLKKAEALDPKNPDWAADLGELYSFDAGDSKPGPENKSAKKALAEYERARENTAGERGKSRFLNDLATMAFAAGEWSKSRAYAQELVDDNDRGIDDDRGIHEGNIILGRIALREGNLGEAKTRLLAAGKIRKSSSIGITGPSMTLARELFQKGEREAVLEYFKLCGAFWKRGADKLERWTKEVGAGLIPDFDRSRYP